ncbi:hypothetical protein [Kitasatospora sp. CB02891]|uniref:hypothetical protein n=1 Tax=Kitasatospora sp. CB02891 TaxID=2020329 RepID=UPI001E46714F|nr:hypothetical protein [Kitasatospora sp. CB02891]
MDMALAMVAEDHGQDLALMTARTMVMYVKRSGGQSQFSVPLSVRSASDDRVDELRRWIAEHLTEDLSLEALAARLHVGHGTPLDPARVRCWAEREHRRLARRGAGAGAGRSEE